MEYRVEHRVGVQAPVDRIWDIVADLPGWSDWNPMYPRAEGALGIGQAIGLTERVEGLGDREVAARIVDWTPLAQVIWSEKRGWGFSSLRYIEIEELAPGSCIVANGEIYSGWRGEGFHKKNGRAVRRTLEAMGEAIRARAEAA